MDITLIVFPDFPFAFLIINELRFSKGSGLWQGLERAKMFISLDRVRSWIGFGDAEVNQRMATLIRYFYERSAFSGKVTVREQERKGG